jgi:hypothetical protein
VEVRPEVVPLEVRDSGRRTGANPLASFTVSKSGVAVANRPFITPLVGSNAVSTSATRRSRRICMSGMWHCTHPIRSKTLRPRTTSGVCS